MATRDREAAEYRAAIRQSALESGGIQPIFQADFLLVQLPGAPLALHTVCNATFLQSACDEEMSLTTVAYEHTPQLGVAGLWGTFKKIENAKYDAKDAKSGSKFVRHHNVTREHVVLPAVKVWLDKSAKALRIEASSLKELAKIRPHEFSMPD
ncbi:MAG: hypothetical protein SGPRY_005382, partial [Prymnesium sp.]